MEPIRKEGSDAGVRWNAFRVRLRATGPAAGRCLSCKPEQLARTRLDRNPKFHLEVRGKRLVFFCHDGLQSSRKPYRVDLGPADDLELVDIAVFGPRLFLDASLREKETDQVRKVVVEIPLPEPRGSQRVAWEGGENVHVDPPLTIHKEPAQPVGAASTGIQSPPQGGDGGNGLIFAIINI